MQNAKNRGLAISDSMVYKTYIFGGSKIHDVNCETLSGCDRENAVSVN